ncbi:MAG: hypothetical protein ACRDQA_00410 [Nocardioidaceae bacterium]
MSDGTDHSDLPGPRHVSAAELARQQGVGPIRSVDDLCADLFESDEELEEFLADVRASRQANLA